MRTAHAVMGKFHYSARQEDQDLALATRREIADEAFGQGPVRLQESQAAEAAAGDGAVDRECSLRGPTWVVDRHEYALVVVGEKEDDRAGTELASMLAEQGREVVRHGEVSSGTAR